jgi:hypothetical protein
MKTNFKSVDEYIENFPKDVRVLLHKVRKIIIKKATKAVESIFIWNACLQVKWKP